MKQIKILGVLLFSAAAAFFLDGAELILQPLFNSCSVYFKTDVPKDVSVFYREKGSRKWLPAFETVFDRNFGGVHRTGIVDLKSGTEYEVKAQCSHRRQKAEVIKTFKTWSEDVPVAKRIVLKPEEVKNGFVIRDKGTPEGWILYTAAPGTVINGAGKRNALILDQAQYVIVENMTVRGGEKNAVILNNCRYVRLRNLDISAWGDPQNYTFDKGTGRMRDKAGKVLANRNAIYLNGGFGQVIERCYIHDPLMSANCWRYGHPDGPQGISPWKPEATVIRYNDICGSDLKWWNDGIAGTGNFDLDGGLNKDCDVYGNFIAFANDDAIELDGGQQNVRCYRNHFENCYMGISIQGCMTGPSFVFENRITDLNDELMTRSRALKTADIWAGYYAASFIYNNTTDKADAKLHIGRNFKIVAVNNILDEILFNEARLFRFIGMKWENNLVGRNASRKDIPGKALFTDAARGIYSLKSNSPGAGRGRAIPGLNRKNPDLGVPRELELPLRPFGLSLTDGRKALFTVRNGKASAPHSFTVRATEKTRFTVRKSLDSDWYEVTPSQVSLNAGETVKLTVRIKAEKMKSRINYRSVFFLRTPEGWSRPVTVMAVTDHKYPENPAGRLIFRPGAPFKKVPGGVRFEGGSKKFQVRFTLKEPGGVNVYVTARALEPVAQHDSLRIGINNETPVYFSLNGINSKKYREIRTKIYSLPAGTHTLTLLPRESFDLKNVIVVTDVRTQERR